MARKRGTLFLVVGPSGAGKDSLIDGAKLNLLKNDLFSFPQRYITRPQNAGGEDHISVSEDDFDALLKNGEMLLSWSAHGLRYGVPMSVETDLSAGCNVVINVSRAVIDHARKTLPPVEVIYITVSDEILTQRLLQRGRENLRDIKRRVARAGAYEISGKDVHLINNDQSLKDSISEFLRALQLSTML